MWLVPFSAAPKSVLSTDTDAFAAPGVVRIRWIHGKAKVDHPSLTYADDMELEPDGTTHAASGSTEDITAGYKAQWRKGQLVLAASRRDVGSDIHEGGEDVAQEGGPAPSLRLIPY